MKINDLLNCGTATAAEVVPARFAEGIDILPGKAPEYPSYTPSARIARTPQYRKILDLDDIKTEEALEYPMSSDVSTPVSSRDSPRLSEEPRGSMFSRKVPMMIPMPPGIPAHPMMPGHMPLPPFHGREPPIGRVFNCPYPECNQSFVRKQNLKSHLGCHSNHRPFICQECGQSFRRRQEMLRHHRSIHGGEDSVLVTCPGCQKPFSRMDAYHRHLQSNRARAQGCLAKHAEIQQLQKINVNSPIVTTSYGITSAAPAFAPAGPNTVPGGVSQPGPMQGLPLSKAPSHALAVSNNSMTPSDGNQQPSMTSKPGNMDLERQASQQSSKPIIYPPFKP